MFRLTAAAFVALALAIPATSQAKPSVKVISGDEDGNVTTLASFPTAKCRNGAKKDLLKWTAQAKRGGWRLSVNVYRIPENPIPVVFGGDGPADINVYGPGGQSFSNLNDPGNGAIGLGAIKFGKGRKNVGIGFSPAFDPEISSNVSIAGGLKCQYPKKKRRRR